MLAGVQQAGRGSNQRQRVQQTEAAHQSIRLAIDRAWTHDPSVTWPKPCRRRGGGEETLSGINYPSPSRRFAGSRADTSGPSSLLNCAFQSDPLNNMNRPATRRGNMRVATAQMP